MKKYKLLMTVMMIISIILVGCGNQQEAKPNSNEQQEANEKSGPRVFKHYKGETEIPVEPKRVVALAYTGHVLAAGVKPVGVTEWDLQNHYLKEHLEGVESIGEEPNLEKILELQPDLIIGAEWDEKIYDDLSKIAPTILIPWMENDVYGHLEIVADALGKKDEANKWLKNFEATADKVKKDLKNNIGEDETLLIFRIYPDSFSVYGDRNMGHVFYRALGLTPHPLIQDEIEKNPGKFNQQKISLEVLPEYAADHMIVMVNDLKEQEQQLYEIQNSSIWKGLPAVQNNQVYFIERNQWLSYDPISLQGQLQDVVSIFEQR